MDEIVIDDKKYLSSKQAAKVTGYAKDYIGQLCREGRIPARLVGRSWYILESALKDHRFGGEKEKTAETDKEVYSRYEADELEVVEASEEAEEAEEPKVPPHIHHSSIQEAWEAWFDRVAHTAEAAPVAEEVKEEAVKEEVQEEETVVEEGETVAIHELKVTRETRAAVEPEKFVSVTTLPRIRSKKKFKLLRFISVIAAILSVGIAALNTGYFDSYIISSGRDLYISGINIYKK